MGQAGRTAYEKIYHWETEEKKLLAFYSSFIGKGSAIVEAR
jgi:hypothetical protein